MAQRRRNGQDVEGGGIVPDFGLNSWTTGDASDIGSDLAAASAAGWQGVELRDGKIEPFLRAGGDLAAVRAEAAARGLRVLSVSTLEDATLHEGAAAAARLARCRTMCGWARDLASPCLIVGPSYLADGAAPDPAAVRDRTAAALASFAEAADAFGIRIGFEYHGYQRCSVHDLAAALAILEACGDARVGLVLDAFHFYVGGSRLEDLERVDPARILMVHLADVDHGDRATLGKGNRVLPGDGVLPLPGLIGALRRIGYQGPYGLELFRPDYWALPPEEVARLGIASMRRFF